MRGLVLNAGSSSIRENEAEIRDGALNGLSAFGIAVDPARNEARSGGAREIQADGTRVKLLVVPTDEDLEIAGETGECSSAGKTSKHREPGFWPLICCFSSVGLRVRRHAACERGGSGRRARRQKTADRTSQGATCSCLRIT